MAWKPSIEGIQKKHLLTNLVDIAIMKSTKNYIVDKFLKIPLGRVRNPYRKGWTAKVSTPDIEGDSAANLF